MERSYRGILWVLAVVVASIDLVSKYAVFRWLYNDGQGGFHDVAPGWFRFLADFSNQPIDSNGWRAPLQALNGSVMPRVNHGALFGVGGGFGLTGNGFFAAVSILAAVAIILWSLRTLTARDGILCTALGLILGGTLGNLFDRLTFHGVRDFMHFYKIDWPVFNFADCCLVAGAGLLLLQAVWPSPLPASTESERVELANAK